MAFSALLDACVLYPVGVRDLLLSVAERGVYMPYWTDQILEEMERNVIGDGRATPKAMARMRELMNAAFPAATIKGYESLISSMTNDQKDRHVLAAAVRGNIGLIVTNNTKDFPAAACEPYDVEVQTPDEFLSYALDHDPPAVIGAVSSMSVKRTHPRLSPQELVVVLSPVLPTFCAEATPLLDTITPDSDP
ncbi:MAG: PIN domain-containing protein [Actinomycetota bacterium]|nr:PIN domain-containing protein [Actinomycetota bacterium]